MVKSVSIFTWMIGFLTVLYTTICVVAEDAVPGVEIRFEGTGEEIYVTYSASIKRVPSASNAEDELFRTRLYVPASHNADGCGSSISSLRPPNGEDKWTIVLRRGGTCNFHDKLKKAQDAGASAAIVVNTVAGLYNSTSHELINPCSLNCQSGYSQQDRESCEATSKAQYGSKGCFTCAENLKIGSGEFCCVDDALIDMYIGKDIRIPSFFASIEDGERVLLRRAEDKASCTIAERAVYEVDPSVFIIGFLGCFVLAMASYRAASKERSLARWIWSSHLSRGRLAEIANGHEDYDHEQVHLSVSDAGVFVITSTLAIGFLFFLVQFYPHAVVRVLQFIFALGSMGALAKFAIIPLIRWCLGTGWSDRPCRRAPVCFHDDAGQTTVARFLGIIVAAIIAFTWLFERHEPWAWILLDILAASICTSFLLTLRLPSLKVGTALLSAFFFYDIFMVFITPSLFSGKSVMVDVATAGRAREEVDATKCIRQEEERVPMLFAVPRVDWYGGYALLGLGDVVLPGLLVVLALRFDYAKLRHLHRDYLPMDTSPFPKPSFWRIHAYWIPLVLSYSAGLTLTFVANIRGWTFNGVRGQPALLYLVPCTLGCFFLLMWKRGDYSVLWHDAWLEWEAEGTKPGDDDRARDDDDAEVQDPLAVPVL